MSSSNDTNRIESGDLLIEKNDAGEIEIHNRADGESVTIGSRGFSADDAQIGSRKVRDTEDTVVSVPEDFPTVQEGVDAAVALSMEGSVTVSISEGTYNEDVVIPGYLVNGVTGMDGAVDHLTLQGDSDSNGDPTTEIRSLLAVGATGVSDPSIMSIRFLEDNPSVDEPYSVVLQSCMSARLRNCAFGTNVSNGIIYYQSGGKAAACNYDNVSSGVHIKRGGNVTVTESKGSPDTLINVAEGIGVRKNAGTATPNVPISLSGGGGIAIDKTTSPPEIMFPELVKNPLQLNQGAGYPKRVNVANITPDFDGQMLRDNGSNFLDGEYAYADTDAGVWRAMSDPVNSTAAY